MSFSELLEREDSQAEVRVNLGCGRTPFPGWVNVDKVFAPGVTIVADADEGLPMFNDGIVDVVYASHVLEHVVHFDRVMNAIHRILRPGGMLVVRVPYGHRGLENPYHRRVFTGASVREIVGVNDSSSLEKSSRWRIESYRIRRVLPIPWLHKPRVAWWDILPFVWGPELIFTLVKV